MILIADDDRNILMSLKLLPGAGRLRSGLCLRSGRGDGGGAPGGVDLAIIDMNYSRTTSGVEGLESSPPSASASSGPPCHAHNGLGKY